MDKKKFYFGFFVYTCLLLLTSLSGRTTTWLPIQKHRLLRSKDLNFQLSFMKNGILLSVSIQFPLQKFITSVLFVAYICKGFFFKLITIFFCLIISKHSQILYIEICQPFLLLFFDTTQLPYNLYGNIHVIFGNPIYYM